MSKLHLKIIKDAAKVGIYLQLLHGYGTDKFELKFHKNDDYTWIGFATIDECMIYTKKKLKMGWY